MEDWSMGRCTEAFIKILSGLLYISQMNMPNFKATSPSIMMIMVIIALTNPLWMEPRH